MTKREEIIQYGLTFEDAYVDTPFRDENWVLLRYRKSLLNGEKAVRD